MQLKKLEISGFKSFAKKCVLTFDAPVTAIVGPNGSGKSNVAEAVRWVLGEQSLKSLRGKRGEDLIFNGSAKIPRMGRADVAITFDNTSKAFDLDFDEVTIEREVHRDGVNVYKINGSPVRLRDIIELMSAVSLGPSGHHIISQGEADRVLNANPKERREILEDALGLKIYQYKKTESEKRLLKTRENMERVESLRREIAPHIKFLKKQVDEIEKSKGLKMELKEISKDYFAREATYMDGEKGRLESEKIELESALGALEENLNKEAERIGALDRGEGRASGELIDVERALGELRGKKDEISRSLGRVEGLLEMRGGEDEDEIENKATGEKICKYCGQKIISVTHELEERRKAKIERIVKARAERDMLQDKLEGLVIQESELLNKQAKLKRQVDEESRGVREAERALFELKSKRNELKSALGRVDVELGNLRREGVIYGESVAEVSILIGENMNNLASGTPSGGYDREEQESKRRKIEKLKIRIEDMGVAGGSDVIREYEDTISRDKHLESELKDLEQSAEGLVRLMQDLTETLEAKLKDGLHLVNKEFQTFFEVLFDGGSAGLSVLELKKKKIKIDLDDPDAIPEEVEDDEEGESDWGIDIKVNLPRKKIKGLEMLSGGERALTSIALLFAMSQVNPPPFLILDETDAALDEANSRRYGDMVASLSKKSQLILITHNRETMSHADIIYGVTMGSDSASRLLSIKFDEATSYAK